MLFFSCVLNSFGQEKRIIINGQVLGFKNPIPYVHIYSFNSLAATSTLSDGKFEILVRPKDTIIVSHIKYRTLKIIVTETHLKQDSIIIYMKEMTNYLDTVFIKNHNLTGILNIDAEKEKFIKIDQKYKLIEEYIRLAKMPASKNYGTDFEKPPIVNVDPTAGQIGGSGGPGASSDMFRFKFKDLKIRRELRAKRNFPKEIITDFGVSYFTEILKIPKEKIHHFLTYCNHRGIMSLYQKNEIMKVLTILQEESIEYIKVGSKN